MAYLEDKKPGELTALTSLATDDVIVVGDTSDASEVAKGITKANLITDLTTSFATSGHNHTGVYEPANANLLETTDIGVSVAAQGHNHTGTYAPALGADDNYVTDAEKIVIGNTSGTNTGDNATNTQYSGLVTNATHTGDVTGATALTIAAKAVTLAKMDDVATASVFYRKTAGTGAPEVQTLATLKTDLGLSNTNSGDQTSIVGITGTKAQFDTAVTDGNFMYVGDAPTSHVHALSEITDSTSEALGVGTLEVGHASDTTLSRVSAGVVAIEGNNIITADRTASDTVVGIVEIATTAETNTGTDAGRAVSADGLAGSYAGTKSLSVQVYDGATDVATGDGKAYITIPEALNGMNLVRAQATVVTAGTTNATTVMVHNKTDAQDMLSGAISIASGGTVGTVGTINTTYDDVATNDVLRIDVDSVSTTPCKGLMCVLEFRLP